MSLLFFLVPAALVLGLLFLGAFVWAVRRGQFDDLETPPLRILLEDNVNDSSRRDGRR